MSSPSLFSKIRCFLSLDRFAVTPVRPEKLFIVLAKFVRLVVRTDALIVALLLTLAYFLKKMKLFHHVLVVEILSLL